MKFFTKAVKSGEASHALAVMGGFAPLATALVGIPLLNNKTLHGSTVLGLYTDDTGGVFIFFSERMNIRKLLPLVIAAGLVIVGLALTASSGAQAVLLRLPGSSLAGSIISVGKWIRHTRSNKIPF